MQKKRDIKQLNAVEPLDYARGFTEFLGCRIDLSKKPLIPRPETEFWVNEAIENLRIENSLKIKNCKLKILDMFAGSGCIGIALTKTCPELIRGVVFADKYENCLQQIKINLRINKGLIRTNKGCTEGKKYVVVKSDVFSNIKGNFNYIFANPPYVAEKFRHKVQQSVLEHEPHQALFAGRDGLFYIKKFLLQAKNYLNPEGLIFMEFSPEQKKGIEKLLRKYNYSKWEFNRDQFGRWRWVCIGFC